MKLKRTAKMDCFDREGWIAQFKESHQKDNEIQAYLEGQFPDCEWTVTVKHATGKIQMHRSMWALKFEEKLDGLWTASLEILNIDVQFNALQASTLEEAVRNLKQRLRHYSEQFAKLAKGVA